MLKGVKIITQKKQNYCILKYFVTYYGIKIFYFLNFSKHTPADLPVSFLVTLLESLLESLLE